MGLYVEYAVSQLEVQQVSQYTSISACIHTCKSQCLRLAAGVPNRGPTWPPAHLGGISVTTWGARHHGNIAVADDSCASPPTLLTNSSIETSRKYWRTPSALFYFNEQYSWPLLTVYLRPILTPNCNFYNKLLITPNCYFYNKLLISHQIAIFHNIMMEWKKFTIQNILKKVRKINNLKKVWKVNILFEKLSAEC